MRAGGISIAPLVGLAAATGFAVVPSFSTSPQTAWIAIVVALIGVCGAYSLRPGVHQRGLPGWTAGIAGPLYVGLLLGHLHALRHVRDGAWWVFLVLIMTWAYDTGAFGAGRLWGRTGFMRHISPSKTREGVLGGLVLAGLSGLAGVPTVGLSVPVALMVGVLTGVVAQAGDLVESMFKRQTGVKDSGAILPGHGGLLDRIDSLLFTGALGFYVAMVLGYAT